jgi:hypothetical protein
MSKKRCLAWMTALLVGVTLLGARLLNYDLLFTDEYLSMRNAGLVEGPLTYLGVIERTTRDDVGGMGVLYHIELKAWGDLVGGTPYSVRAFSLLWGVVAVAWLYRLGADMAGRRAGLYAAALLGTGAFFIDYLHEARAYTQFVALTVVVVWLYWRIHQQPQPRWGWHAALALALGWLLYTHYLALAMGAALGVYHLMNYRPTRRWWQTVGAMIAGGLLFVPWLGNTLAVAQRGLGEVTRHNTSMTAAEFLPSFFITAAHGNALILLMIGGLLMVGWRWRPLRKLAASPAALIGCWLTVSIVLIVVVNARIPFMVHLRYLIFLLPALALLAALALRTADRRRWPGAALVGMIAIVGAGQSFNPNFVGSLFGQVYRAPSRGIYQAMEIVRAQAAPDDALLIHVAQPGYEPFQLFPNGYLFRDLPVKRAEQFELMNLSLKTDDNSYLRDALPVFEGVTGVWTAVVPEVPTTNRSGVVNYILATQFAECGSVLERPDVRLRFYLRPAPDQAPTAQAASSDTGTLQVFAPRLHRSDQLYVTLLWHMPNVPRMGYSYSLRLLSADGQTAAAHDAGLPEQRPLACTRTALPWAELSPGSYQLVVYVYNWQTLSQVTLEPLLLAVLRR